MLFRSGAQSLGQRPAARLSRTAHQHLGGVVLQIQVRGIQRPLGQRRLLGQKLRDIHAVPFQIPLGFVAGQSAQRGANAYLGFLAVLSIGLFVLNMIPLPMLDGGHLVYCAIEIFRGRALSEAIRMRLQQLGLTAILALTMIALWNDFSRFF